MPARQFFESCEMRQIQSLAHFGGRPIYRRGDRMLEENCARRRAHPDCTFAKGMEGTSLDDVRAAAGVSGDPC
jgi:hypothetical protein